MACRTILKLLMTSILVMYDANLEIEKDFCHCCHRLLFHILTLECRLHCSINSNIFSILLPACNLLPAKKQSAKDQFEKRSQIFKFEDVLSSYSNSYRKNAFLTFYIPVVYTLIPILL
jgi:hypothetical protein